MPVETLSQSLFINFYQSLKISPFTPKPGESRTVFLLKFYSSAQSVGVTLPGNG